MTTSGKMTAADRDEDAKVSVAAEESKQASAVAGTLVGIAVVGGYVILSHDLGAGFAIVVGILLLCAGTFLGVLRGPVGRAWARKIDASHDGGSAGEIDALHARIEELEAGQQRLTEIEERLDFAERLLTRGRDAQVTSDKAP
jgi:hypothetical protein